MAPQTGGAPAMSAARNVLPSASGIARPTAPAPPTATRAPEDGLPASSLPQPRHSRAQSAGPAAQRLSFSGAGSAAASNAAAMNRRADVLQKIQSAMRAEAARQGDAPSSTSVSGASVAPPAARPPTAGVPAVVRRAWSTDNGSPTKVPQLAGSVPVAAVSAHDLMMEDASGEWEGGYATSPAALRRQLQSAMARAGAESKMDNMPAAAAASPARRVASPLASTPARRTSVSSMHSRTPEMDDESHALLVDEDEYADQASRSLQQQQQQQVGGAHVTATPGSMATSEDQYTMEVDDEYMDDDDVPPPPPPPSDGSDGRSGLRSPAVRGRLSTDSAVTNVSSFMSPNKVDPEMQRTRERQERLRAIAASLADEDLNEEEKSLIELHREHLEETSQLLRDEAHLLQGLAGVDAVGEAGTHPRELSRGDMARYTTLLLDVMNRKFTMVTDLLRKLEDYQSKYGREIGLVDPLDMDTT
ncbi:MAG: hypothetical protein EOO41_01455 [Methanobacteriota archaeon]|nr:MAG: hypothetical protein EOO41_01455 [Euryarchaeota archaeon]